MTDPLTVDVGPVGRIEVRDQELVVCKADDAMLSRDALVGKDNVGGRGAPNLGAGRLDDDDMFGKIALLNLEAVDLSRRRLLDGRLSFGRLRWRSLRPAKITSLLPGRIGCRLAG